MRSEAEKAIVEVAVFREFAANGPLDIDLHSIEKRSGESEPDIVCHIRGEGSVAFELAEICSEDIAELVASVSGPRRRHPSTNVVTAAADPTEKIVRNKVRNIYRTELEIELVCYTNGRVISTDRQILEAATECLKSNPGPFRRAWLLGEEGIYELWRRAA